MHNGTNRPLIEVKDLKEYFNISMGMFKSKPLKAVDGVSFTINKGETLGLVGESGCGKTTVGRTILHLYKPTAGEIWYDGKKIETKADIHDFRKKAHHGLPGPVFLSQSPHDRRRYHRRTPGCAQALLNSKQERQDRILELMRYVGLNSEHAARYAHEFSGGQRQRIGIARALAVNPDFIVCDEPVSALDVSIQAQVINMFEELQEQPGPDATSSSPTTFSSSSTSPTASRSCTWARWWSWLTSAELYQNPLHPYTKSLLSAVPDAGPEDRPGQPAHRSEWGYPQPAERPLRLPLPHPLCLCLRALCPQDAGIQGSRPRSLRRLPPRRRDQLTA